MHPRHNANLPIQGSLSLIYILSGFVAVLVAIVSILGLWFRAVIYPTDQLLQAFVANDVVNLLLGVPILLGSMWLARRGKLIGLLCWPGALFFVFYNYTAYVFAVQLNWVFLLYLILVMASIYTLAALIARLDGKAVQQKLNGVVPEKFAGGVLTGLGLLFSLRVIGVVVGALTSGTLLPETELATSIADFLTTPAWVIGGILLWQHKEFGYLTGLGLLFQGSMLFISLIIFLLLQPVLSTAPFAIVDVIVVFGMGLICFVPFVLFARGAAGKHA